MAAWMNVRRAAAHPEVPIPAEAYVKMVSKCRINWAFESRDTRTARTAAAIRAVNARPEIQAEYKRQGIAPIEGAHSYAHLDKKYPIK